MGSAKHAKRMLWTEGDRVNGVARTMPTVVVAWWLTNHHWTKGVERRARLVVT